MEHFETDRATFYGYVEDDDPTTDPYSDDYDPTAVSSDAYEAYLSDVPCRVEPLDRDYVSEVYGEASIRVYRIYADPLNVGTWDQSTAEYDLQPSANDRVEFAGVDGRFSLEPPKEYRLDSPLPEHIEIEVVHIGD